LSWNWPGRTFRHPREFPLRSRRIHGR
jgi:hypothetical protein